MAFFLLIFAFLPFQAEAQSTYFPFKRTADGQIIAPFGDPEAAQKPAGELGALFDPLGGSLENSSSIDTPHRSDHQLGLWSGDIVVRATSFTQRNARTVLEDIQPFFTPSGWAAYQRFLKEENISDSVMQAGFKIASYTLNPSEMLGKGAANGVFKWVFDVPLFIENGGKQEQINIIVQITRVQSAEGEHDVKIEDWKVERLES